MRKVLWLMHVSLDGFVGGPKGELNWITVDEQIFADGHQVIETADTAIYGRTTYGLMEAYWPTAAQQPNASQHDKDHAAWAKAAQKLVFSTTLQTTSWEGVRIVRGDPAGEIAKLKASPGKHLMVLGSPGLATTLLDQDLIDEIWFNVNPVILGGGIRLTRDLKQSRSFKLAGTRSYANGVVTHHYLKS